MVPKAAQFFVTGEVSHPAAYRLEPGLTVLQAIAQAGGVTARGSERRVEIKRTMAGGEVLTISAKSSEKIFANDVIRVKESIF